MMLSRSRSVTRTLRALVALVAVWCTGCTGFEPIMDAVLGSQAGMACGSSSAAAEQMGSMSAAATGTPIVTTAQLSDARDAFACGCASCHAVTLSVWAFTPAVAETPAPVEQGVVTLLSVIRTPLLPPPERST